MAAPPRCSPERVARAIVRVLARPRRELFIGGPGRARALLHEMVPAASEKATRKAMDTRHFQAYRQPTSASAGSRSPVRQWLKRLLFAGGLVAAVASLQRSAPGRRLGLRVAEALET